MKLKPGEDRRLDGMILLRCIEVSASIGREDRFLRLVVSVEYSREYVTLGEKHSVSLGRLGIGKPRSNSSISPVNGMFTNFGIEFAFLVEVAGLRVVDFTLIWVSFALLTGLEL